MVATGLLFWRSGERMVACATAAMSHSRGCCRHLRETACCIISGVPLAIDAAVRLVCWGVFVTKSFSFGDAKRLLRDVAELQRRIRMAPTRMD